MQTMITQMQALLRELPVDTNYEQSLLDNLTGQAEMETLLVTGDRQAAPFTLLPLEEQLFTNEDDPGFPLRVEYAETFSIRVTNQNGEYERYQTVADFRRFCAGRFREITACTVNIPNDVLRRCNLVYFQLDHNVQTLNSAAKGCTGCVLVMAADGAGLTGGYLALCTWLTKERCISERVCLLLNYRGPFANRMLPHMVQSALGRDHLGAFKCGVGKRDCLPVPEALRCAMHDLQGRTGADMDAGVLRTCRGSLEEKLNAALEQQRAASAHCGDLSRRYDSASRSFQAMCDMEKYSLSELLSDTETDNIHKEIRSMFLLLRDRLPQMVDEVVSKSDNPKEDLKNLAGDYLGDLTDAFLDELLSEVSTELLIPRAHKRFLSVCDRFRTMMQDTELEYEELENSVETELLRMGNINVGEYRPPFARIVSTLITTVVKSYLIYKIPRYGYMLANMLDGVISNLIANAATAMMTKRQYARSLCKAILDSMEQQEAHLHRQVEETILPRLSGVLQEEFDLLTKIYHDQLLGKAADFAERQENAAAQVRLLEEKLDQLTALC